VRTGDDEERAATFRDIVVIVPSRTELETYEDALTRAGVPHRHEGGRTFYRRQEVGELVSVLRAIDDPNDGVACVAALRSPAFGCSDEELLIYRAAGGKFDGARPPDDAPEPVASSIRVLRALAELRHDKPLPDLVRRVLDDTRLVEFAMLQPQGDQVAANLLKLIDQSRAYAEATGGGLRGFVRWLKENIDRAASETDASISEETDDVVRIVTIHASKGLEFPIVVFANMSGQRRDATDVIADHAGKRLHVKLGSRDRGFLTPGYADAETDEKEHRFAEEVRLLYVASTRAKDRLVVSIPKPPGKGLNESSLNYRLAAHGGQSGPVTDTSRLPSFDGEAPVWRRDPAPASAAEIAAVTTARDAWTRSHDDLVARGQRPLVVRTATSMKPGMERVATTEQDVRRGKAADFGTAVHAALEHYLVSRGDLDAIAAVAAEENGQQERAADVAAIARRALASPVMARAIASPRMLPEVPFTAALPPDDAQRHGLAEGIAEGRIDLLFVEDGELVIVDFKTDSVSGAEIDRRAAHYRNQTLVYAWAAQRATGMPVREVVLLFATPGEERSFPANPAFMAEAEALLRVAPDPTDAENLIEV
jgi:ATP-dependent helicase/nuclease subunit A